MGSGALRNYRCRASTRVASLINPRDGIPFPSLSSPPRPPRKEEDVIEVGACWISLLAWQGGGREKDTRDRRKERVYNRGKRLAGIPTETRLSG